jgi:trans-AT polyketide synthase/acyltransferase/oxidoreductase domain-containing protein
MSSNIDEYNTLKEHLSRLETPFYITIEENKPRCSPEKVNETSVYIPAVTPETLGSKTFRERQKIQYAYSSGAMAGTIASSDLVIAMAKNGFLSFFGSGGAQLSRIEEAIEKIKSNVGDKSYGFNLLANPFEPKIESDTVEMYLKHGIDRISASAYIKVTPYVIRYRASGLTRNSDGSVKIKNRVLAKLSRREVAEEFLSPAPEAICNDLVQKGLISQEEAQLAMEIPVADDLIAEADSGGHTDKRPFISLIPQIISVRNEFAARYPGRDIHVGAAGGISTPQAITAAFAMGADFVLSGSINQSCVEAGTSDIVKEMLSKAEVPDVRMAPAADMFESGAQVQVLKYGTMYAMRAEKLYQLYKAYQSIEEMPQKDKLFLEKSMFHTTLEDVWNQTSAFFEERNPSILEATQKDPHKKMALVFRWYLGKSSRWAAGGDESRKSDFQVWCGPSMGSFNQWVKGSRFESRENRSAPKVALALMEGASYLTRLGIVRNYGIEYPVSLNVFEIK